jgi:hypothetical protein
LNRGKLVGAFVKLLRKGRKENGLIKQINAMLKGKS